MYSKPPSNAREAERRMVIRYFRIMNTSNKVGDYLKQRELQ
jgi:hypothetical protein